MNHIQLVFKLITTKSHTIFVGIFPDQRFRFFFDFIEFSSFSTLTVNKVYVNQNKIGKEVSKSLTNGKCANISKKVYWLEFNVSHVFSSFAAHTEKIGWDFLKASAKVWISIEKNKPLENEFFFFEKIHQGTKTISTFFSVCSHSIFSAYFPAIFYPNWIGKWFNAIECLTKQLHSNQATVSIFLL